MFEACMTYEAGIAETVDFPPTDKPVWILGKQYSAKYDLDELRADVRSKIWMTYRKNFPAIGGTGPTSDSGWGCMLRCGQMVLAQALVCRHLGRDWLWKPSCNSSVYKKILKLFEDKKRAIYSIHQIAQMGESEGKAVGQWFGPNTVAQVLRKLAVYDEWSSVVVYIAMDNTIIISEIKNECKSGRTPSPKVAPETLRSSERPERSHGIDADRRQRLFASDSAHKVNGFMTENEETRFSELKDKNWKPLLLFIPLRLGLSDINPIYIRGLKNCFTFKQSLGLIGGRPNHAYYFIGFVDNDLVYLDPHTVQPTVCLECGDAACTDAADDSYHCPAANRMDFLMLDPSVALCFYCATEEEFDQLCEKIQRTIISQEATPLFEICQERQWFEAHDYNYKTSDFNSDFQLMDRERTFDTSDDEYELL